MSEGPIKRERDGSTTPALPRVTAQSVHLYARTVGYCGRTGIMTNALEQVTCTDCLAALRADGRIS